MSTFNDITRPAARKLHRCEWCAEMIPTGEIHVKYVGEYDGDFQSWRMHDECYAASSEITSEGFTPGEHVRGSANEQ